MKKISNARVAAIVKAGMRGSYRDAAKAGGVDKNTGARVLRDITAACGRAWHDRAIPRGTGAVAAVAAATKSGPRHCAIIRDLDTGMITALGYAAAREDAVSAAANGAGLDVGSLASDADRLHLAMRGAITLRDDVALHGFFAFKAMAWNLCTTVDSVTPAMRAGIRDRPLGPWGLWLETIGVRDFVDDDEEPIDDGPLTVSSPRRHIIPVRHKEPTALELRDAEVMAREFGRLHVVKIHYRKAAKMKMSVPAIESCFCKCLCGSFKSVSWPHLRDGETVSCGCVKAEQVFGDEAKQMVDIAGKVLTIGQAATLANMSPTSFMARLKRGSTAEGIVLARQKVAS